MMRIMRKPATVSRIVKRFVSPTRNTASTPRVVRTFSLASRDQRQQPLRGSTKTFPESHRWHSNRSALGAEKLLGRQQIDLQRPPSSHQHHHQQSRSAMTRTWDKEAGKSTSSNYCSAWTQGCMPFSGICVTVTLIIITLSYSGSSVVLASLTIAVVDLFDQYAKERDGVRSLNWCDIRDLLRGIGENPVDENIAKLFAVADQDGNGVIDLNEFLEHEDTFLGDNPARIILVVGGPGSGKGMLSKRLMKECNVVHLSSGDLLRREIADDTQLGRTVKDIMSRGELVSSAIMVALMKKRMRDHPGKRVLLDGFPRSIENAADLVTLCGLPELALHLVCDDTILMERIMERGSSAQVPREDDNFHSALKRLRTFHTYHHVTMDWLRNNHVPIVNLDCSGSAESVWSQLVAIGRLMRPAVKLPVPDKMLEEEEKDWSSDPMRTTDP